MRARGLVILLLGLGGLIGLGAWYLRGRPRLLEVLPQPGAQSMRGKTPIQLTFSRPMQPESVESRLSTRPEQPGAFTWEGDSLIFTPYQPWPRGETVEVHLAAGARSAGAFSLPMQEEISWTFSVRRPRLAYLWPAQGQANLYALDPVTAEASQLTASLYGILDFSLAADGERIYLSEGNASGGSDLLWLRWDAATGVWSSAQPLLACPQAVCSSPRPSPDGAYLAYERNPLPGAAQNLFPQVYLLDLPASGQSAPGPLDPRPAGDPDHASRLPEWSSQGILSFFDAQEKAFILLDPENGESTAIHNETGESGDWSPDGNMFVAPEIIFPPGNSGGNSAGEPGLPASHLMAYDLETAQTTDLSATPALEDAFPAFAPHGGLLVFARKYLDPDRWTPGRQIWLMQTDGSQARQLTDDPYISHSSFAWNPDATRLAYLRFNQEAPTDPVELWMMDADGSRPARLVVGAYAPQWIP